MSDARDPLGTEAAFSILGNETRLSILRQLGEADEPLAFSELYERVEATDSAQFNYHLDKTVGSFVTHAGDRYELSPAGERVLEAILAGTVTTRPDDDRTPVDEDCYYCGGTMEVAWRDGALSSYCADCDGRYGSSHGEPGYLGYYPFPPAGVENRSPEAALRAAWTWGNLQVMACASGVCPRCSAPLDREVVVCDDHAPDDGVCATCDRRYAVGVGFDCTNCVHETGGDPIVAFAAHPALVSLLADAGIDPIDPDHVGEIERVHGDYEETIRERDPLRAAYTFTAGDDRLTLVVDETLAVVDSHRE